MVALAALTPGVVALLALVSLLNGAAAQYYITNDCPGPGTIDILNYQSMDAIPVPPLQGVGSCSVVVTSPAASTISITTTSFSLILGHGFLYVYDGSSTADPQLAGWTGTAASPMSVVSSGNVVLLVFESDTADPQTGFSLNMAYRTFSLPQKQLGVPFIPKRASLLRRPVGRRALW